MECVAVLSELVEKVATPLAPTAPVPSVVVPSRNVVVPVIEPAMVDVEVAVNVTDWPFVEGFGEEVSAVLVAAFVPALTTWLTVLEVDPSNPVAPE